MTHVIFDYHFSDAFDNYMAVGILRLQEGLDYSDIVEEENATVVEEKPLKTNKSAVSLGKFSPYPPLLPASMI